VSAVLILYGSRARGEADKSSDTDLILAEPGHGLKPPHISNGVSVHWYSQGWLHSEAQAGNLFAYHVAFEGVPLHDPHDFLKILRKSFVKKASYRQEANEASLVLNLLIKNSWNDSTAVRRRYFWALRTLLVAEAADHGAPVFSASALEQAVPVPGLAQLIKQRESASIDDCLAIGKMVLARCDTEPLHRLTDTQLRDHMMHRGGMAADSVRLLEEPEMIAGRAHSAYC